MKRLSLASLLAAAALLGGCAGLSMQPQALAALAGHQLVVSLPEEIPFSAHMTLLSPSSANSSLGDQMMESLGKSGLDNKIGGAIVGPGSSLGADCSEFFARELRGSGLFAGVNHAGGEAHLDLKVGAWGLAWDESSSRYMPLLELDASLSLRGLGEVWRCQRSAQDASSLLQAQAQAQNF